MKSSPSARHRARKFAVQALYQLHYLETSATQVVKEFVEDNDLKRADVAYFETLVKGASAQKPALWDEVAKYLDRESSQIDPVEESILLLGAFELKDQLQVPFKVVISEAVDLAKIFGATDSFKYVNSILDKVAGVYRSVEVGAVSA
ncbi:MAG: transcription antitermination factor NusB [Candidatus Azotimanducaceae bacterium]